MQFSHPDTERSQSGVPVRSDDPNDKAYENLFHEPEFAPGTAPAPIEAEEPAPRPRRQNGRTDERAGSRRTTRRRYAA